MPEPPRCPICGKEAVEPFRPFCSGRCARIDLGRWLGGVYRVTAEGKGVSGEAEDPAA